MHLGKVKDFKFDLEAGPNLSDETIHINQPAIRNGEVEMILPFDSGDLAEILLPFVFTRTITLFGSDPWPSSLKKGTKVEISANIVGISCVIKGVVTKRYVRKLVVEGTIEVVQ